MKKKRPNLKRCLGYNRKNIAGFTKNQVNYSIKQVVNLKLICDKKTDQVLAHFCKAEKAEYLFHILQRKSILMPLQKNNLEFSIFLSQSATLLIRYKQVPTTNDGPNGITAVTKKTICNAKTLLGNTCTLVEIIMNHLIRRFNEYFMNFLL